jgi:hypothetical protein
MHGCNQGSPVLLPGVTLEREPDYLAEYVGGSLISDTGEACAGPQQTSCELALTAAEEAMGNAATRALITIDEQQVRLWAGSSVLSLLGRIDTPEDALLYVGAIGYFASCEASVVRLSGGAFRLHSLRLTGPSCGGLTILPTGGLDVYPDGSVGLRGMGAGRPADCSNGFLQP